MFDLAEVKRSLIAFERKHEAALRDVAQATLDFELQALFRRLQVHRRSGQTIRDQRGRIMRTAAGRIIRLENDAKQARFLEKGTRPHIIRARRSKARRSKALRFIGRNGAPVFRRWVLHPGTPAFRLFSMSHDDAGAFFERAMRARMEAIAAEF